MAKEFSSVSSLKPELGRFKKIIIVIGQLHSQTTIYKQLLPNAVNLVSNWGSTLRIGTYSSGLQQRAEFTELLMRTTIMMMMTTICTECLLFQALVQALIYINSFNPHTDPGRYSHYPHFINKKTKIQRGKLPKITELSRKARMQTQAV